MKEIDPVEELHKIRRTICKEAGGTPAAYARYYLEMSKKRAAASKTASETEKPRNAAAKTSMRKPGQRCKAITP